MTAYTISSGVTSTGLSLGATDVVTILSGGTASATVANAGSTEIILGGGLSLAAAINPGALQTVSGTAIGAIVIADSNDGLSAEQDVGAGGIASNTSLSQGALEQVTAGGMAIGSLVGFVSQLDVSSGGMASSAVVSGSYATETVYAGGVASGMVASAGGTLSVASGGSAAGVVMSNGGAAGVSAGGVVTDLTVLSGGTAVDAGTVNLVAGDVVSAILVQGTLNVAPGSVIAAPFTNDGTVDLLAGTAAPFLTISGSGVLKVESGSTLGGGLSDAGQVLLQPGAAVSGTSLTGGGTAIVSSGAALASDTLTNFTVVVSSSASAADIIVNSGGLIIVTSGSLTSNVVVNSSGTVEVDGNTANIQADGGTVYYYSGGVGTATVLSSGAQSFVYSSGTATDETVSSGAAEYVYSGGTADGTVVSDGGFQYVYSAGVANSGVIAGGQSYVYSAGLAVDAVVTSNGTQTVYNSGSTSATTLGAGGFQVISVGGTATDTVVQSGGQQAVLQGGTAIDTIVDSGGTLADTGATSGAVLSGGTETDGAGGVSFGTDIVSGGFQIVSSGGTATSSTIGTSGTLHLLSGGTAAGAIQFAGPAAVLLIDGTTMPAAPINGFTYNEAIDISALDYVSSATLTIGAGDLVTIAVPFVGTESLTIAGASEDVFSLSPLAGGGTQITLVAPAPSSLALSPGSDTGAAGDGITTATTPLITGLGVPGDTITLYDGETQVGTALVGVDGTWSTTTSALSLGAHDLTAAQTDSFGNVSAGSTALSITIVPAPAAPTLGLAPASDSGALGDGVTSVASPVIAGTGTAGDTVTLYDGVSPIGTATVASDGTWSIETDALSDGPHALTAIQTDANGNESLASATFALSIDTSVPDAPSGLALAPASDSGVLGDGITDVTSPIITGVAAPGSTVTLYDGGTELGSGLAGQSGLWSITTTLAIGLHDLTAVQTDVAGTSSAPSEPLAVTIQDATTTAFSELFLYSPQSSPAALGIAAPSSSDYDPGQLVIAVVSLPSNGSVTLADGTPLAVGQTLTSDQLTTLLFTPATSGAQSTFVYSVTDPGGSLVDGTITLTAAGGGAQITTAGQIPNQPTPTIAGTAVPGAPVTLRANGVPIGSGTADSSTGAFSITASAPLPLGLDRLTVTTVLPGGATTASAPLIVFDVQAPVASVSTTDFSSGDIGNAINQGAALRFVAGTQAVQLTDGTLSVGTDTGEATIQRLYEGLLGRVSDSGGISFYDAQLIAGASPSSIAAQIMASPEYGTQATQTDAQFVTTLYTNLLGRSAGSDAGFSYWTGLLASGASRADVAVGIANAAESKTDQTGVTSQLFVTHAPGLLAHELYETGLGREVELMALGNVDQAFAAITPAILANQIASSPEFATDHAGQTNAAYVNSLYLAGLGRAADASASYWTGLLDSGGASRADVLLGIATTPEAQSHLTSDLTRYT